MQNVVCSERVVRLAQNMQAGLAGPCFPVIIQLNRRLELAHAGGHHCVHALLHSIVRIVVVVYYSESYEI
jgi:hypothetical protein